MVEGPSSSLPEAAEGRPLHKNGTRCFGKRGPLRSKLPRIANDELLCRDLLIKLVAFLLGVSNRHFGLKTTRG